MKILHTADWHLGKIVNSVHMTEDQAHVLAQFIDIVREEKPDLIIIAGDIYDRSIPPKEAVELLDSVLTQLITDFDSPVLIISGNHDSPDRLQFGSRLFRENDLFIETKLTTELRSLTFDDAFGPVHFHLIPYIEPADARSVFEDETIQSHQQAMEAIVSRIKERENMEERHVLIGHAFLAGGMETDSEERLSMIGGSPYVDSYLFKDFSYVALGHLHQPQKVTYDWIQYSGSILKYSFSEASNTKSVTMINLAADKTIDLSRIPLKPKRDLRIIEGYFDDFINGNKAEPTDDYLHIRLLDDGQILDPIGKLRQKYPNILRLERKVLQSNRQLNELNQIKEKQKMTHAQLFHTFYEEMKGEPITKEREEHIDQVIQTLIEQERGK
ncbi:exonuclease SbcCD subunit D [Paraliobacillus sediminis]|uniref:exonuclease SbcCD subunit D n=1 Tax=Paraliobacillus sediminis TaxID=1885916 RepID=UPI000E3B8698|nr:exonuclease SbcCD subunit D [Paraliobacillus sediminis]